MHELDQSSINFNLEAPTYGEINKIIFKMKLSASPCPLDQINIIVLKKCPYLRTYLWRIGSASWIRGDFPTVWKRGITVLAYKKDSNEDPSNFRPIICNLFYQKFSPLYFVIEYVTFATKIYIESESAKLRALRAKNVLTCQHDLRAYLLTCQRVVRAYVLKCQRALRSYVLTYQRALRACSSHFFQFHRHCC